MPFVTPFAGVWIEMRLSDFIMIAHGRSPPSRGCGLKFQNLFSRLNATSVTPFAGVWIEMF